MIKDETVVKPESEKLRAAVAHIGGKYPADDVALYLSTLVSQDPDTWGELAETAAGERLRASSPSFQFPTAKALPIANCQTCAQFGTRNALGFGNWECLGSWKLEVGNYVTHTKDR